MKNKSFLTALGVGICLLTLLLLGSSCQSDPQIHPLLGRYTGELIIEDASASEDDSLRYRIVHHLQPPWSLKLKAGSFSRPYDGADACTGSWEVSGDEITLTSGACGCWCQCLPNVDCGGDPILGTFTYTHEPETGELTLFREETWTREFADTLYRYGRRVTIRLQPE
ncbi:MAG: hypothetical protein D6722_13980 [Bacteroidetes bacterium]|nr:MAG: hypothetical protein D6722_13980 [Bacteroidota bacterium]